MSEKNPLDDVLSGIEADASAKETAVKKDKQKADNHAEERRVFDESLNALVLDAIKPIFDRVKITLDKAKLEPVIEQRPREKVNVGRYVTCVIGIRCRSPKSLPGSKQEARIFLGEIHKTLCLYATDGKGGFDKEIKYHAFTPPHSLEGLQKSCEVLEKQMSDALLSIHGKRAW